MFITDWICILTSGNTIDGRKVPVKTVNEMAASYDPELYNARINIDHERYSPKLGSVLALKVVAAGEQVKLFAKLQPNKHLLSLLSAGQKIHNSVEIMHNFAKTGKAYLVGLAATDDPASVGTTAMHLSAQGDAEAGQPEYFCNTQLTTLEPQQEDQAKPSLFNKLFNTKHEEQDMTKNNLMELAQSIVTGFTSLGSKLDKISEQLAVDDTETPPNSDKQTDATDTPEQTALQQEVKQLTSTVQQLSDQIGTALAKTDDQGRTPAHGGNEEFKHVI